MPRELRKTSSGYTPLTNERFDGGAEMPAVKSHIRSETVHYNPMSIPCQRVRVGGLSDGAWIGEVDFAGSVVGKPASKVASSLTKLWTIDGALRNHNGLQTTN